jgi:hypothetical protein
MGSLIEAANLLGSFFYGDTLRFWWRCVVIGAERFGYVANAFVTCRPALVTERMSSSPTTDMLGQEEIN